MHFTPEALDEIAGDLLAGRYTARARRWHERSSYLYNEVKDAPQSRDHGLGHYEAILLAFDELGYTEHSLPAQRAALFHVLGEYAEVMATVLADRCGVAA